MRKLLSSLLAGLVLALSVQQACATILFAGGEDSDVVYTGAVTFGTVAGNYRSGYARGYLVTDGAGNSDPPSIYFTIPAFTAQQTIWVHAEVSTGGNSTANGMQFATVYGSDGLRRLMIRGTGNNGQVKISTRNTAGTITDLQTCTANDFPNGALQKLDWYINYAVSGETALYENGIQICDYVGDITTNSVTAVNQASFSSSGGTFNGGRWSEIIVATTDTRNMNLMTCAPQANGTNMAWSGSYANVNPTTINDASVISTGSSGNIAEFTCPSLPAGTFTVPAISQTVRFIAGTSGPQSFYYIARPSSGSSDYNNGSAQTGTTAFANYQHIWSLNPACSCGWSTGDLGSGVNFGLESQP